MGGGDGPACGDPNTRTRSQQSLDKQAEQYASGREAGYERLNRREAAKEFRQEFVGAIVQRGGKLSMRTVAIGAPDERRIPLHRKARRRRTGHGHCSYSPTGTRFSDNLSTTDITKGITPRRVPMYVITPAGLVVYEPRMGPRGTITTIGN